jgi:hypothetical protein
MYVMNFNLSEFYLWGKPGCVLNEEAERLDAAQIK